MVLKARRDNSEEAIKPADACDLCATAVRLRFGAAAESAGSRVLAPRFACSMMVFGSMMMWKARSKRAKFCWSVLVSFD